MFNNENTVPMLRFSNYNSPWNAVRVNEISDLVTSGSRDWAQYYSDSGCKFIRMTNLPKEGINLILEDLKYVSLPTDSSEGKRTSLLPGDILISITAELGKIGLVPENLGTSYINQHTALVRLKEEINSSFFAQLLASPKVRINLNRLNDSGAKAGLNLSSIKSFKCFLPKLEEQKKIADFLSSIDKKISLQKEKFAFLTQYKKCVMQKLFKQEIRFRDDSGNNFPDWQIKKLGDCFAHHNDKNGGEDNQLLSVKMNGGVVPRNEIVGKDNSSDDKSKYLKVDTGDIVYNSMRMWQGASGLSKYNGIVSPAYTVITPKENYCAKYFSHFFKFPNTVNLFRRNSQGLTSDTWNLKFPLFSQIKVAVPSQNEQEKIAEFLDILDTKLNALNQQIELTQTFKKGLMQQMFV
ncbi:restriction endonuclease subunit S [Pseudoalteromonas shioyasakiensis]|jgi:type I restriction enzyme S subunit|uniref:restriction endonuclease subunit S n=1 Tax=Pseudoalteromonas shioyasakiensis TaxID=1190813 RepID=UPI0020944289|nr:restriction endonuclease subunit S [Pseudoalteromonas shioyasakiensis]MCO6355147.1 restriction endonuclease subunit S [Pseudoalteromonas shioyasakiensis]